MGIYWFQILGISQITDLTTGCFHYFEAYYTKHFELINVYDEKGMVYDEKAASTWPIRNRKMANIA